MQLGNTLSEEVVFDGVVSEVSIVDEEQNSNNQNRTLIVSQSSSNDNNPINQFIQQTIKSPVANAGHQVASIRNVMPNTKAGSKTPSPAGKVVNNIVLTPKNQAQFNKSKQANTSAGKSITIQSSSSAGKSTAAQQQTTQTISLSPSQAIPISNNQQILTKVIMTTSGQQLLITSPVKQQQQPIMTSTMRSSSESNNHLIGLVPVSPAKQQQAGTGKGSPSSPNVSIRPKPANLTIQSPVSQAAGDKQPQYQIIRLVSASNSGTTTNSTIKQITTANLTGAPGQQKVLIPASALKGLNATQLLGQSSANSGQQQFLMYAAPTQIIQQAATTPKQVTFSTATGSIQQQQSVASGGSTSFSSNSSNKSFVPILPNPSGLNSSGTGKTIHHSKAHHHQNGPKGDELAVAVPASQPQSTSAATLPSTSAAASASAPSNRPRKPCNCTRSQCLKLYCDCFANGEFCSNCNCINCSNNLDHEESRQKAIKQCLERNPHAFHPKIGKGKTTAQEGIERRHTKGCNCRRSGCLKNYCECYEAKILCTDLCKCCACKNYEDSFERKSLMHLVDAVDIRSSLHGPTGGTFQGKENDPLWSNEFRPKLPVPFLTDRLISCSFITNDLVDATTQCLVAQAEKSQKLGLSGEEAERAIIEEFGSCLSQIIEVANKERREK